MALRVQTNPRPSRWESITPFAARRFGVAAAAAFMLGPLVSTAIAGGGPDFMVGHWSPSNASDPVNQVESSAPITGFVSNDSGGFGNNAFSTNASGSASLTTLSIAVDCNLTTSGGGGNSGWNALAITQFVVYDLEFSSTDGSTGFIDVQLNAELCSAHTGFCTHDPSGDPDPPCQQDPYQATLSSYSAGPCCGPGFTFAFGDGPGQPPIPDGCAEMLIPAQQQVSLAHQPQPFGIGLWAEAHANVHLNGGAQQDYTSVSATLTIGELQPDGSIGPIFVLPPNITVNAPSINLVDNYIMPDSPACPADLTSTAASEPDGQVNVFDLLELLAHWGTNGTGADIAEPNDVVDVFDLLGLLSAWGACN